MDILIESLRSDLDGLLRLTPRIVLAAVVMIICYLLGRGAGRGIMRLFSIRSLSTFQTTLIRKLATGFFLIIGLMLAMSVLGLEKAAASLLAGGGLIAVVLGFAFKEIGENFLAGLVLTFNRPFNIGDVIESEGISGSVRDIEMRYTHIRTEDGRDVYVPNAQIFNRPLVNFTKDGLRRFSFRVGVDYGNDSAAACRVLKESVGSVEGVLHDPGPGAVVSSMQPEYVEITVYYWTDMFVKKKPEMSIRTAALESCRKALLANGFTVSSDCVTNLSLASREPIRLNVDRDKEEGETPEP